MLKYLVVVILLINACVWAHKVEDKLNLNSDEKSKVAEIESKCVSESNAKLEEVHEFDKGTFADNKEIKCFYKCLLTSFGVMNDQGKIVHSKISLLVPDKLKSKTEHCFNVEKGEPCDTAYEVYKCFIKNGFLS